MGWSSPEQIFYILYQERFVFSHEIFLFLPRSHKWSVCSCVNYDFYKVIFNLLTKFNVEKSISSFFAISWHVMTLRLALKITLYKWTRLVTWTRKVFLISRLHTSHVTSLMVNIFSSLLLRAIISPRVNFIGHVGS